MPGLVASILLIAQLAIPSASAPPTPVLEELAAPPDITAGSWLVYDVRSDTILAQHNATERRPMASVTKLMSALVASQNSDPSEVVIISEHAAATGEAEIGLVPGELWTMRELLAAMLVRSGNDAAVAVAEHIAGSEPSFIDLMNRTAAEMGMADSSFANPHGLDNTRHYSTAVDLLTVAKAALDDPLLTQLMRTHTVKFRPDPEGRPRRSNNTNKLLGLYPGIIGMKTGFTGRAGQVLISAAEFGDRTVIAVVMGSRQHFADSRALLDYALQTHGPVDIMLAPLAMQQGGGGTVASFSFPEHVETRLDSAPLLDNGRWALSTSTPLQRSLTEQVTELLPGIGGGGE